MNAPLRCPLCRANQALVVRGSHAAWDRYACQACRAEFWWPLSHPGKEFYNEIRDPDFSAPKSSAMLSWAERQFLKHPPVPGGTLLDIGCGAGDFLAAARRKGFSVWGCDISDAIIRAAKKNHGLEQVYAEDLGVFMKRKGLPLFDVITAFEVLEHLPDPDAAVKAAQALLRPGGYLVVAVPNAGRVGEKKEHWDYPPHHFWRWSKDALARFLGSRGFSVLSLQEQPYGAHILYEKGLLSFGVVRFLKSRKGSPASGEAVSKHVTQLANYKNFFLTKALAPFFSPITLLGRLLGWKYVELYCVAQRSA